MTDGAVPVGGEVMGCLIKILGPNTIRFVQAQI